jgi:hypothetical protein
MARRRRRSALDDFRADERERQRACRERRCRGMIPASSRPVSRAALPPQLTYLIDVATEALDKTLRLSRAALKRDLVDAFRDPVGT